MPKSRELRLVPRRVYCRAERVLSGATPVECCSPKLDIRVVKAEIKPNVEYALREKRTTGARLQRVRVIAHVRGNKWKVQWIDPNPGLTDYIESGQLVALWAEHKAFLKEEENAGRMWDYNERHGYDYEDSPLVTALYQVFESVADGMDYYRGELKVTPEVLERFKARAGIAEVPTAPPAYTDRQGRLHLPFDTAIDMARRFCAAEPSTVLVGVEVTERDWTHRATHNDDYLLPLLNQYRAAWALIRQWAGTMQHSRKRTSRSKRWRGLYGMPSTPSKKPDLTMRRAGYGTRFRNDPDLDRQVFRAFVFLRAGKQSRH